MPVLILLLLGVIGFSEMVLFALLISWVDSGLYELIGPGSTIAKISVLFSALGSLGIIGFIFELVARECRLAVYKALSALAYVGLLFWVSYLYMSV